MTNKQISKECLYNDPGMTLRNYLAAKAMQGWISCSPKIMGETLDGSVEMAEVISTAAYVMADAMLKAREVQA
jgi:hypothetical protein